jgi:competence protein ComEC
VSLVSRVAAGLAPVDPTPGGDQSAPPDLRMVPIALAGWSAAALGTWATRTAGLVLVVGLFAMVVVAVVRRSAWWAAVGVVLAVLGGVGAVHAHRLDSGPVAELARGGAVVSVLLEIRTDPVLKDGQGRSGYVMVRATVRQVTSGGRRWQVRAPGLVVAGGEAASSWARLPVGAEVTALVELAAPDRGADLAAVLRVRGEPALTSGPSPPERLVERVRGGLRAAVAGRAPEPRALVPALVVGDTSGLSAELQQEFAATGLAHLTAVSGANLTLLLAFVLPTARWAGVRGWWLRVLGLLGVVAFVALCRTEPSVLRAAAMGLVALAALGSGARRAGLRNLAVAMTALLLLDPYLSRSVGFALSVLASAGIIAWARSWSGRLARWLPGVVADAVAVPLAAHLTTLPVVAAISGQVSMSGLFANAVAGPFVGPATVLGFAAAGLSLVSALGAAACGFGAAWCAQAIIWVAHYGAQLPGSAWPVPATPAALSWLAAGALATGLAMGWVLARPWWALALAAALVVGLLGPPGPPGWPPPGWRMVACDVGQGDGLVVRAGVDAAVVVDAGPDPVPMRRCLDQLGVRSVPVLVLTHFHADHVDGLAGVLAHRTVGQIWVSGVASPPAEVRDVAEAAQQRRIPVTSPGPGLRAGVGELELEVIGPLTHPEPVPDSSQENDSSLVVMVHAPGLRILLSGDLEPEGQAALLARGVDLRADVLKIPHHGSARQDPAFFAATGARLAVASAGRDNDYGHPAPRTVQLARSLGMTVIRTDEEGSSAVVVRDGRLGAVTER